MLDGDVGGKLLRCIALRLQPDIREQLLDVRRHDAVVQRRIEGLDNVGRRAGRRDEAVERVGFGVRNAKLRQCRQIGQELVALAVLHGERAQISLRDLRSNACDTLGRHIDGLAQQRVHRLAAAAIGDAGHLGGGAHHEHLHRQMRQASGA